MDIISKNPLCKKVYEYICKIQTSIDMGRKSLKNQPRDVIKMREIRGEVGKKNTEKEMDNPLFL